MFTPRGFVKRWNLKLGPEVLCITAYVGARGLTRSLENEGCGPLGGPCAVQATVRPELVRSKLGKSRVPWP